MVEVLVKYPRTLHLPSSEGASRDDVRLTSSSELFSRRVVVTEKLDGENTTMTRELVHARSLSSAPHPSRSWVRALHASVRHRIGPETRICGENLFARHSLRYEQLESYFLVFNVWEGGTALGWDETVELCQELGLSTVPVLDRGVLQEGTVVKRWREQLGPELSEGFVVRDEEGFEFEEFGAKVAKWVRRDHVRTDEHWMTQGLERNGLR